jgi:hypothetical protein
MTTSTKTRSTRRKTSKTKAKAQRGKAAVKRASKANGKVKARKANRKSRKAANGHGGGGKALSDFGNSAKLRVLKPKEIPSRRVCFTTGMTVLQCLNHQKAKGFRGRRKFIRAQIAQGRVSLH